MISRLLRMRRNVNRNVFNDRKNASNVDLFPCFAERLFKPVRDMLGR